MYHFSLSHARILFIFVKNHTMTHTIKCLLVLLFPYSTSLAQFKNIKLDEYASTNKKSEPGVTINRKNPKNIIATATSNNIYYTLDGGGTWQTVKGTSSGSHDNNVAVISDDKGNIYSFHVAPTGGGEKAADQILCHLSNDGGKTWSPGSPVGVNSKNQFKPGATVDSKGNVWVA